MTNDLISELDLIEASRSQRRLFPELIDTKESTMWDKGRLNLDKFESGRAAKPVFTAELPTPVAPSGWLRFVGVCAMLAGGLGFGSFTYAAFYFLLHR